jgi:subtilase family serine protease
LRLEVLEERLGPAVVAGGSLDDGYSLNPNQIRHAYGFDRVTFQDATHPAVAGNGAGQTIALIDAYDDPNVASDLATFDSVYGLPAPPSFLKVNQTGGATYPVPDRLWAGEIALDVEYAHAMAPAANILLVEANDNRWNNLNSPPAPATIW